MAAVSWPRRPMEITQHRRNGYTTCMMGQLMYIFRLSDKPDLAAIDAHMGFGQSQREVHRRNAYFYLLQNGLKYRSFNTFDEARFAREGIPYFRNWFGRRWTPAHAAYYTPGYVRELQHDAVKFIALRRPFSTEFEHTMRTPNSNDVTALLRQGCAVEVTVAGKVGSALLHAGLIVPQQDYPDASRVWLYTPIDRRPTVRPLLLSSVLDRLVWEEGVTAMWR